MKIKAKLISLAGGLNESLVCFSVKGKDALSSLEKYKDKEVTVDIKKPYKERSKDSNSYLWELCDKIAAVVGTNKDDVYREMLCEYGVFDHVIVSPDAVESTIRKWRASKIIGEVSVDGMVGIQIQCYYGSHTYDQAEMNRLIVGVVNECHDLGIETETPDEIAAMNSLWAV